MDWKYFNEQFSLDNCYYEFVPYFVQENGYLPIECRDCRKALIFWDGNYSKANISRFNKMVKQVPLNIEGKYNDGVAIFYIPSQDAFQSFMPILKTSMQQYDVKGTMQWQVSGAYWRRRYPHFFISTKQLKPTAIENEISISEWLKQNDRMSKPIAKIAEDD